MDTEQLEHFKYSQILTVKNKLRRISSIDVFPHMVVGFCERDGIYGLAVFPIKFETPPKEIFLNIVTTLIKHTNSNLICLCNSYYDKENEYVVVEFTGGIKEKRIYQTLEIASTVGNDGEVTMGNIEILEIKE